MEKATGSKERAFQLENFKTQNQCMSYLFDLRWGSQSENYCPSCGVGLLSKHSLRQKKDGKLKIKNNHMRCNNCGIVVSPTSDTLFHSQKYSLPMLFAIIKEHITHKKAHPHYQIASKLNIPYPNVFAIRKNKLNLIKRKPNMTFDDFMSACLKHKKIEPTYVR